MFYAYGVSMQGAYHIKNDVVCQDAHRIIKTDGDMIVAAVADGLGSEEHSDIASRLAVDTAAEYCSENITLLDGDEEILEKIQESFLIAQRIIEKTAMEAGHNLDQYDTTLTLAVVIKDALYYGHSGDSGIIAMATDGAIYKVTDQQRDDMGRVFPLCFEEHWVFRRYDRPVGAVLLATDGMFETFFPVYIRDEKVNIHVSLACFFMDSQMLHFDEGEENVKDRMAEHIKRIDPLQVSDDKTIVVMVNESVHCERQPEEYYSEPDWDLLKRKFQDEWRRVAYPDLYRSEKTMKTEKEAKSDGSGAEDQKGSPYASRGPKNETYRAVVRGRNDRVKRRNLTDEEIQHIKSSLAGNDPQKVLCLLRELHEKNHFADDGG